MKLSTSLMRLVIVSLAGAAGLVAAANITVNADCRAPVDEDVARPHPDWILMGEDGG